MLSRLGTVQESLAAGTAFLITSSPNIAYLINRSEFAQEEGVALLVSRKKAILLHSPLIFVPTIPFMAKRSWGKSNFPLTLAHACSRLSLKKLLFEPDHLTVSQLKRLKKDLSLIALSPAKFRVEPLRLIKDTQEIRLIRRAGKITQKTIMALKSLLKPGVTEKALASKARVLIEKFGGDDVAFPSIVAFGPHTSVPHHHPTQAKLKRNDIVLIDVGAVYKGYRADSTRTFFIGNPTAKHKGTFRIVTQAYREALGQATSNKTTTAVDAAARSVITRAGYGKYFPHGTGHGVGLEIHESPSISPRATRYVLRAGVVITIEPAVYFKGKFGIRHEDTILVTKTKPIVFT